MKGKPINDQTYNEITRKLLSCETKCRVEEVFRESCIFDKREKIDILRECMGITNSFDLYKEWTDDEEYQFDLEIFVDRQQEVYSI